MQKEFSFKFPLKHKVVRDLKIVTEHVGDLEVYAVGYFDRKAIDAFDRYSADIETVLWNGCDIKPVLEVAGFMDEIQEAAVREFANQLETAVK